MSYRNDILEALNEDNKTMRWILDYKPKLVNFDFYGHVDVATEIPRL